MEDFHLLEKITLGGCAEKVKTKVKQMGLKQKQYVCLRYNMRTNIFLLSLTELISSFNLLLFDLMTRIFNMQLLSFIVILNVEIVNEFMKLSK